MECDGGSPSHTLRELLSIARRQHEMGLHDIEVLDWKVYITLAAQLGILGVGQALAWSPERVCLLVATIGVGVYNLFATGRALRTQQYTLAPNVKSFWAEHGLKSDTDSALQLLADIEDGIEKNLAAGRAKGRSINQGMALLFASILLTGVEWFLEWGTKQ